MTIHFDNVLPKPILETPYESSSVWGKSISLNPGTAYQVEAASGRGKSTFVNLIFGTRKDYSGTIQFDGQDISSFNLSKWESLRTHKLAILFQDLNLFSNLTARENIQLKRSLSSRISDSEVEEMAEQLGVASLLNKPCGKLSYGQQQRIALIRTLAQPFEWLLVDEPFSHLDLNNSKIAFSLMEKACKETGAGLILTSLNKLEWASSTTLIEL